MIESADRLALVLAGGGERVIAWQVGVLAGLADAGLDGRAAGTILGTSAGALAAARLAAGADPRADADLIATVPPVPVPGQLRRAVSETVPKLKGIVWGTGYAADETERRRRAGKFALRWRGVLSVEAHVAHQASRLPAVGWPPNLGLVAIDADTGERVVLDASSGADLARGVAAARAVPGLVEPVEVGGRRFIDGALGSATNCDLLPDGTELAIVLMATPITARPGSLDDLWNDVLEAERSSLAARWVRVVVVHASAAADEAMGEELMSAAGAAGALAAGREQGADLGTEILVGASR
jgi:NTE family protein